ncbi:hypothetical protein SAMN05216360_12930 [Methylobacterium phyllostachyos]|uniref:Uncharacterized protein n=1 Tax=Methylobacterium phyllostachyos TaxID=582672 RepID=A0A1H0KVB1_9HYPH|nr:hypothetical protein [Methylobacterium phyllostachyos]SDO59897.1 hypothetical protein SAMN05216360_12930 [Methylobacterium phyllostachyos]
MTTTLDSAIVAEMQQSNPDLFAQVDALRAAGKPIAHAVLDEDTGEVFVSEGPGRPYVKAHAAISAMVTGARYSDPSALDPLASWEARRDPILKFHHEAAVRSMLGELVDYYAPALARQPLASQTLDDVVANIEGNRSFLAAQPTICDRWDRIVKCTIALLEKP